MTWEQAVQFCTIIVNIKICHLLRITRSVLKQTQRRDRHIQSDWPTYTDVCLLHRHKSELSVPKEECESPWQHKAGAREYVLAVRCKKNFNDEWYVCEFLSMTEEHLLSESSFQFEISTLWRTLLNKLGPDAALDVFGPVMTSLWQAEMQGRVLIGLSSSALRGCVH